MTEQTVPFGGTSVVDPPLPMLPPFDDDSASGDNRRKLLLVVAGVGVVVLALAAYFLLKSGGSTPAGSAFPAHRLVPANSAGAAADAGHPVVLPKQVKGPVGRNPFNPLYVAPPPASTTASTTTTGSTTTTVPTTTTTGPTTTSGSTTTTPAGSTTSAAPAAHPVWIQLMALNGNSSASFRAGWSDGKALKIYHYTAKAPKPGAATIFGRDFSLLSIRNGWATITFGDGSPIYMNATHNYMDVD